MTGDMYCYDSDPSPGSCAILVVTLAFLAFAALVYALLGGGQ